MRYLILLSTFYKNALLGELEYRANFVVNVLMSGFWLFWSVFGLQIYFNHTNAMGGWSYDEALVVVGLFFIGHGYMDAFLQPNISLIGDHIRLGTLDFILTKPVNSQFLASMRTISFWRLGDILLGFGIVALALARLHVSVTWSDALIFGLMLVAAAIMLYGIWMLLVTSAFWFVRVDNITELFSAFYEAARFPVSVYRGFMQILLTFIVPIAFITTFPAAALINKLEPQYALMAVALALALFVLSAAFWKFALRFYTSASS